MFVALDQLGIGIRIKQLFQLVLGLGIGLDQEQPAVAVGVFVDRFRLVAEDVVDRDDFAAHRRVHVGGGFHRFHHRAGGARLDVVADVRQFDVDQIAELALRVIGDTDAHLVGVFDAGPLVGLEEFQIAGYFAHGSILSRFNEWTILTVGARVRAMDFRREKRRRYAPAGSYDNASHALPSLTNGYFT